MKSLSHYISKLLGVAAMAAVLGCAVGCQDELERGESIKPVATGDSFTLTGTVTVPVMNTIASRALGDTPQAGDLKLTLVEFDKGSDASSSFLVKPYHATILEATNVDNGVEVKFEVTLTASDKPKIIDLFIAPTYITPDFGSEADVLSKVAVTGSFPSGAVGTNSSPEAYWGRVEFNEGFKFEEVDGKNVLIESQRQMLTNVPVIRNFAKIQVSNSVPRYANGNYQFELLGFDIVNAPTSGTIAPWQRNGMKVPTLLTGSTMLSYTQITANGYKGILPAGVGFRNQEAVARTWNNNANTNMRSSAAKYMYEHPYESNRRTYLIINGNYRSSATATPVQGFYKVDIGRIIPDGDNAGMFEYYNIIRNICYNVNLISVNAPGTATVAEAIDRAPFNNLIAATETSNMLNVSDGDNMLIVNDTNHVIVDENETIDILWRYIEDVTGTKKENNSVPFTIGLTKGAVVKEFTESEAYRDPKTGINWMKITITPNAPSNEVKEQSFTIVDGNGLGRTINLILRKPWSYENIGSSSAIAYSGTSNYLPASASGPISSAAQQPMTVYFNLPDELPETMFPLEFILESEKQGIENNKIGTLVVTSGQSLFAEPGQTITAIQYIKTVTYNEYMYKYAQATGNDLNVDDSNKNTDHTIRCRFLTITAASGAGAIRIHNPYFSPDATATFTRQ